MTNSLPPDREPDLIITWPTQSDPREALQVWHIWFKPWYVQFGYINSQHQQLPWSLRRGDGVYNSETGWPISVNLTRAVLEAYEKWLVNEITLGDMSGPPDEDRPR
jgi:hypothetical protein